MRPKLSKHNPDLLMSGAIKYLILSFLLLFFSSGTSFASSNYVVTTATTATNGGLTNFLETGDSLTVANSGSITMSSNYSIGINADTSKTGITVDVDNGGAVSVTGTESIGIQLGANSKIQSNSGSTISASGTRSVALVGYEGSAFYINGNVSATGTDSYAVNFLNTTVSALHILNGAQITGDIHAANTAHITFGYSDSSLSTVDPSFNFVYNDNITGGKFNGYFAGGTTTLNGTENSFSKIYIGAECFTLTATPDGTGLTNTIKSISGATATLNIKTNLTASTLTLGAGSTLGLYIADTYSSSVTISGTATLSNNSTIKVTGTGGQVDTTYTLLSTNVLTDNGTNIEIVDNSALLDYSYTFTTGANGKLTVTTQKAANGTTCANAASTENVGIGKELDRLSADHPAGMDDLFQALNSLSSSDAVNSAMTQLNSSTATTSITEIGNSAVQMFDTEFSNQMSLMRMSNLSESLLPVTVAQNQNRSKIRDAAGGIPTKEYIASLNHNTWGGMLKLYGGFGKNGSTTSAAGYDFGSAGILAGIDYTFSNELRLGGLINYSYNRANLYNNLGNATDHVLRIGPYSSYNFDNMFVDFSPTVALHQLRTVRNISFMNTTATGERNGMDIDLFAKTGYRIDLPKNFMLTPSYSLSFTTLYDPQYTEEGASGGANLKVSEYTSCSLRQKLQLKLGKIFTINNHIVLLPEIWGGWQHEYLNDDSEVTTAFATVPSQSWTTPVSKISADRANFGASLTTMISSRWELNARFNHSIWETGFNTEFALSAKLKF